MEVVINRCYGGFNLSIAAVKRLAELQGRECYFFKYGTDDGYEPLSFEEAIKTSEEQTIFAFDIPNPTEAFGENDHEAFYKHSIADPLDEDKSRSDPKLVQVVRELGPKANTKVSSLSIIEIPNGVSYEIEEYDGIESIHEVHRSWY